MSQAFEKGLKFETTTFHYSPLKMLPTFLCHTPNRNKEGYFYAIDLGGTNIFFLKISIIGGVLMPESTSFKVPMNLMRGKGTALFDFIADCIKDGFKQFGISGKTLAFLGFSFSFPVNQLALNRGSLIRWTKGYSATGVGEDVVKLLKEACKRKQILIQEVILINDTTGTLLNGAFEKSSTKIGVIVGTGTNA
ncbi:hypothetical protein MXB_5626, partial [Myxobolus squamalis]